MISLIKHIMRSIYTSLPFVFTFDELDTEIELKKEDHPSQLR